MTGFLYDLFQINKSLLAKTGLSLDGVLLEGCILIIVLGIFSFFLEKIRKKWLPPALYGLEEFMKVWLENKVKGSFFFVLFWTIFLTLVLVFLYWSETRFLFSVWVIFFGIVLVFNRRSELIKRVYHRCLFVAILPSYIAIRLAVIEVCLFIFKMEAFLNISTKSPTLLAVGLITAAVPEEAVKIFAAIRHIPEMAEFEAAPVQNFFVLELATHIGKSSALPESLFRNYKYSPLGLSRKIHFNQPWALSARSSLNQTTVLDFQRQFVQYSKGTSSKDVVRTVDSYLGGKPKDLFLAEQRIFYTGLFSKMAVNQFPLKIVEKNDLSIFEGYHSSLHNVGFFNKITAILDSCQRSSTDYVLNNANDFMKAIKEGRGIPFLQDYLVSKGVDVDIQDVTRSAVFDFLVTLSDGTCLEVECKSVHKDRLAAEIEEIRALLLKNNKQSVLLYFEDTSTLCRDKALLEVNLSAEKLLCKYTDNS